MPRTVERTWEGDPGARGGRRARTSFRYQAFVPDGIAGLSPVVPFEVADLSADAEAAIRALNERASVGGLEAIGPLLLRSEAVASSRIEGYDVSSLNLARALVDHRAARGSARTVAANVSAMEEAIAIGDREAPVTVDDLLAIHAVLMAGDERARPGRVREEQNWIGGRLGNPSDAAFVPPPEDLVPSLLEDLVAFVARDRTSGAEREIARLLRNEASGAVPIGGKLFYRTLPTERGPGEAGVMERDIASGAERVLVRGLGIGGFMVSDNREWLAVVLSDAAAGTRTVRVVRLAGGEPQDLLQSPEASRLMLVALAPDGRSLVVSKRPSAGAAPEAWWVPIDGRSPKRIIAGGEGPVGGMSVHPDGRRVVLWSQAAQARQAEVWVLENVLPAGKKHP